MAICFHSSPPPPALTSLDHFNLFRFSSKPWVLHLWSLWLPSLRTNWSKCSLSATWVIPFQQRGKPGAFIDLTCRALSGVSYLHNSPELVTEVQFRMCWSSLDTCLQELSHSVLLLQPLFLPLFLSSAALVLITSSSKFFCHFSNL